jgi:hypothetical protein
VVNYVRDQLELGLIQVLKIKGELNNADLHTKKLRDKLFATKAEKILGSPARLDTDTEDGRVLTPSLQLPIVPTRGY